MTTDDAMTLNERNKYLRNVQARYQQATTRVAKSALLDEAQSVTSLGRNYLIQKLGQPIHRRARKQERGRSYGPEVDAALVKIAQAQGHICAERLVGYLVETADNLARYGALRLAGQLRERLARISVSTLRRHLASQPTTPRARSVSAVPNTLQRAIPVRRIPWDVAEPGHCEVDLVHHGGPEPRGQYGYTLQLVDVATGWSGRRAILGRSYVVVADAFYSLFEQFPFPIRELHVDNGGEFLNELLLRFLQQFYPRITISRSAPGQPNDNRFVEQKNATLVRAFLGDWRLDTVTQIRYLNTLYLLLSDYYNLWQPVMHQVAKERLATTPERPAYTHRQHDRPRPPLERLCDAHAVSADVIQALRTRQQAIDLLTFRERLDQRLAHLFTYPHAQDGRPENVFETLAYPELFPAAFVALDLPPASRYSEQLPSFPLPDQDCITSLRKEPV